MYYDWPSTLNITDIPKKHLWNACMKVFVFKKKTVTSYPKSQEVPKPVFILLFKLNFNNCIYKQQQQQQKQLIGRWQI